MSNNNWNIQTWAIDKLIGYARNPRINDHAVDQLASAIKEFGFRVPVIAKSDGTVVDGHLRLKAAKKLGMTEVPIILADDMTEAQIKAFRINVNRMAELAEWDMDLLKLEVVELKDMDYDLENLGFEDGFLDELLAPEKNEGETDPDDAPPPPIKPISKLGDLWILGNHRLMCGDSTSVDAVEKLMDGNKADMVFTDPPYGISYQSNERTQSEKFDVIKNDNVILDIVPIIEIFSKGWVFIWTTWKVLDKWLENTKGLGFPSNMVIWFKGGGGIGDLKKTFSTDYETALVWHRGAELCGKRIGSVWKVGKDGATNYLHPTQKPVALAEEALDKTTKPNYIVLDLFGGSGSTMIAAEKNGRISRTMELDPKYVDVIIQRWQQFTGKTAILESNGQSYEQLKLSQS
jgi:DNA modification methylase